MPCSPFMAVGGGCYNSIPTYAPLGHEIDTARRRTVSTKVDSLLNYPSIYNVQKWG